MSHDDIGPGPWTLGDNIPWHDPGFSSRMLKAHLSQDHDRASRRLSTIDRHVQWIHNTLLPHPTSRVLDLGCGPGFYLHRLALLGHHGVGIDYSPASIAYAKEKARRAGLQLQYRLADMRRAPWGAGFDLIMLIFGEFNVFCPQDAELILRQAAVSLAHDGRLLLEVHTADAIRERGQRASSHHGSACGLFSNQPHQCTEDNFWHAAMRVATTRYTVTQDATSETTVYAASYQAYTNADYDHLLRSAGFRTVTRYTSLTGAPDPASQDLIVLVAQK